MTIVTKFATNQQCLDRARFCYCRALRNRKWAFTGRSEGKSCNIFATDFDLLNLEDYTTVEYSTKFNKQHNLAVLYSLYLFIFNSCDGTKLFNNILKLFCTDL